MYTLLRQCRLCWLGHVHQLKDGCIPKDILYGGLTSGKRPARYLQLCFKDVWKHDMMTLNINSVYWEEMACYWERWRTTYWHHLNRVEDKTLAEVMRTHEINFHALSSSASNYNCPNCSRDCHSSIRLTSHS